MNGRVWLSMFFLALPLAAASPSPDGKRMVYSFIGGPESLFLANADGSGVVALVDRATRDARPEWFRDGRRVLFSSATDAGPQLVTVDIGTLHLHELTAPALRADDGHPSPDGTEVVFFRDAADGFDLLVLDVESGALRELTNTPEFRESSPRWSPEGRRVAFVGRETAEMPSDIWILDLDTGERRNLTKTSDSDESHPAWSDDGQRIAFVRVLDGECSIQVLDLATGDDRRVAHQEDVACFSPHFTPDGEWVTFTRNLFEGAQEGLPGVYRVRRDGRDLERVSGVPERSSNELHPSWSPDGEQIVFESDRAGSADLYIVDASGGEPLRLTASPADDARPTWSPDGSWIAFHSDREGDYDLYAIRPDGSQLRRLTSSPRDETNPAWDPASKQIVFEDRVDRETWHLFVVDIETLAIRPLVAEPGSQLTPTWMSSGRIAFSYSPPGGNHDTDLVLRSVDAEGRNATDLLGGLRGNSNVQYSPSRNRLVFNSIRDGDWEIYSATLDGGDSKRLTTNGGDGLVGIDGQPEWSPTGDRIAFTSGAAGSLDLVILRADGEQAKNLTRDWRMAP